MGEEARVSADVYRTIAGVIGFVAFVAFTAFGYVGAENVILGGIAGLLLAIGSYLALPIVVQAGGLSGPSLGEFDDTLWRGMRRFPTGLALVTTGVAMMAGILIFEGNTVIAVALGVFVGLVDYKLNTVRFPSNE